jgi:hypothetical protein
MQEAKRVFVAQILPPTNIPTLNYGWIYHIILGVIETCPTNNIFQDVFEPQVQFYTIW